MQSDDSVKIFGNLVENEYQIEHPGATSEVYPAELFYEYSEYAIYNMFYLFVCEINEAFLNIFC